ncbi:MAG: metallopeptidase [Clostridiaceae bacterium]|nr:metallopeptidase [Clostridiaceae bacterium]
MEKENPEKYDNKEWEVSTAQLLKVHGYADNYENAAKANRQAKTAMELAKEILNLSRHTLFIHLRFMEAAFVKIVPDHDIDTLTMATDGTYLYYNSAHICRQFRRAKEIPVRDYLHVILHCVFCHIFVSKKIDAKVWDLACDIAVENLINKLNLKCVSCERQTRQAWLLKELEEKLPKLSAEWIYKYFMEENLSDEDMEQLRKNFMADEHFIWYHPNILDQEHGDKEKEEEEAGEQEDEDTGNKIDPEEADADTSLPEGEEGEDADRTDELLATIESEDGGGQGGEGEGDSDRNEKKPALKPETLKQEWRDIAERIQMDLETFSNSYGEGAGEMQQQLRQINKETYDYADFLKHFAVLGENIEINDDEFDYIFYTYGMKLYDRMPLVEPLEYKEVKKIREFVIAIDTSESVSGEIVQKFVTKTWNILKQTENFFRKINIHIIQCGARVEEDVRISSQEEFDEYIRHMVLKGFGGTDFRPVFTKIEELKRQHEFANLKGMIYFTDGYGAFPNQAPSFDAAFVFLDQGYDLPQVPPWVIRMLMTEDEIREL